MEEGMLKIGLTALVTAGLCFGLVAATGFASQERQTRVINIKPQDRLSLKSNNFQCLVLTKKQVACGRNKLPNQVHVYFDPKQLQVVRFNKAGTGATVLFKIAR
jgi:hypothetical protein